MNRRGLISGLIGGLVAALAWVKSPPKAPDLTVLFNPEKTIAIWQIRRTNSRGRDEITYARTIKPGDHYILSPDESVEFLLMELPHGT